MNGRLKACLKFHLFRREQSQYPSFFEMPFYFILTLSRSKLSFIIIEGLSRTIQ
jgi:hypothetical protein